ncbi:MAG: hypothetical protein JOY99_16850 [Sphingomonadaceae bacterium]|nr:hypothetical protein [Sphingomonadaceae bacterium]
MSTLRLERHRWAALGALAVLSGCAAGSTSSFTQAPLFFSEQTDRSGTIVATAEPSGDNDSDGGLTAGSFDNGVPSYVSAGGNALLPVLVRDVAAAAPAAADLHQVGLSAAVALAPSPDADIGLNAAGRTTALNVGTGLVAPATAALTGALPASATAALGGGGVKAGVGVGGLSTNVTMPVANPTLTATLTTPANSATLSAGPGLAVQPSSVPAVTVVSQALQTTGNPLGGSALPTITSNANSLVTSTAANLVHLCPLRGC